MSPVHLVLPADVDDPARASGGNRYDRALASALVARGVEVVEVPLDGVPDDALVLVDGLVAQDAPGATVRAAARTRLVVLAHMAFATPGEAAVLPRVAGVVATSRHTAGVLVARYGLRWERVRVATPGVEPADLAVGTPQAGSLLSVTTVVRDKGHDLLLEALARVPGRWTLTCAGSLERDPAFVRGVREQAGRLGLADRVRLTGVLEGSRLGAAYAGADLVVHPTRREGFGMVVTEALARGLPVVASAVGGVPEALGDVDGRVPGILVPPDDPAALGTALRRWLTDASLRGQLRADAAARRTTLTGWDLTAWRVATALDLLAQPGVAA
ncbi:MAG: group 1 glycosyl transferase protein [Nocardioidaceae bacterium]|nr:group 1 glycosyl transferase protein [Nocardioidaceae bacterium]